MKNILIHLDGADAAELQDLISTFDQDARALKLDAVDDLLKAAATCAPDLILLSAHSAEHDAAGLIRQLRETLSLTDVAILFVAPAESREQRLQALEAGATDLLAEPIDLLELITRVRALLERAELRRNLISARRDADFLQLAIEQTPAVLAVLDNDRRYVAVSAPLAKLLGATPDQLISKRPETVLHPADGALRQTFERELLGGGAPQPARVEDVLDCGGASHPHLTARAPIIGRDGNIIGLASCALPLQGHAVRDGKDPDLSDQLTGLPGEAALPGSLKASTERAAALSQPVALYSVTLTNLREINNVRGRAVGDRLVVAAARRLNRIVTELHRGASDIIRGRGDTFVAILIGPPDLDAVRHDVARIKAAMQRPFQIAGEAVASEVRTGAVVSSGATGQVGELVEALWRAADCDQEIVDVTGGGVVAPSLQPSQLPELVLDHAITHNELAMYYQAQIALKSGRVSGVEALLRWQRPGTGLLGPAVVLEAVRNSGRIGALTGWITSRLVTDARLFTRTGLNDIRLSLNLSAEELSDATAQPALAEAIRLCGSAGAPLDFEVTVTAWRAHRLELRQLRQLGAQITIDSAGEDPISLARDIADDAARIKLLLGHPAFTDDDLAAISACAHEAGLTLIGANVEHAEHLASLRAAGVDEAQGFFIQRPMSAEELIVQFRQGVI